MTLREERSSGEVVLVAETEEDTFDCGRRFAAALRPGDVVFVEGRLGAGKTCFVRGVCAGLGYEGKVRSPSYTIVNKYAGRVAVYHVDLYRIPGDSAELEDLSRDECFSQRAVTLVEWGEKMRAFGVVPRFTVRVEIGGNDVRRLRFRKETGGEGPCLEGVLRKSG